MWTPFSPGVKGDVTSFKPFYFPSAHKQLWYPKFEETCVAANARSHPTTPFSAKAAASVLCKVEKPHKLCTHALYDVTTLPPFLSRRHVLYYVAARRKKGSVGMGRNEPWEITHAREGGKGTRGKERCSLAPPLSRSTLLQLHIQPYTTTSCSDDPLTSYPPAHTARPHFPLLFCGGAAAACCV